MHQSDTSRYEIPRPQKTAKWATREWKYGQELCRKKMMMKQSLREKATGQDGPQSVGRA